MWLETNRKLWVTARFLKKKKNDLRGGGFELYKFDFQTSKNSWLASFKPS